MLHTWDEQIMRLRDRVDELEEQNSQLSDLLTDTIRILAVGEARSIKRIAARRITKSAGLGCDAMPAPARK
jgi:hypothetical protein